MKLAINGGDKVRTIPFPNQACIGDLEMDAARRVLQTQMLSGYRGNAQKYRGGKEVQVLEEMWCKQFKSDHAIAINSCTSALQVACLAIGLKPGDEVIVSPYSMTCSATAPLICGATPVFADVESEYFCIDPVDVEKKITQRTKAIIAVDIFGQPFDQRLYEIAHRQGLWLIEDAAQAPGCAVIEKGTKLKPDEKVYAGNFGHIGCFSFTQGKHMTAGEGGIITTNNASLAAKCRLIMNHAEAVVNDAGDTVNGYDWLGISPLNARSLWGFNLRMTEIQAAILQVQMSRLENSIKRRQENAMYLANELLQFPFLVPGPTRPNCSHSYYVQPFLYFKNKADGIPRDTFINAVKAELTGMEGREEEGPRFGNGYIKPLYRMPIFESKLDKEDKAEVVRAMLFQNKANSEAEAYGKLDYSYKFPVVERLWKDELFLHLYLSPPTAKVDIDDIVRAFHKVWDNREELK